MCLKCVSNMSCMNLRFLTLRNAIIYDWYFKFCCSNLHLIYASFVLFVVSRVSLIHVNPICLIFVLFVPLVFSRLFISDLYIWHIVSSVCLRCVSVLSLFLSHFCQYPSFLFLVVSNMPFLYSCLIYVSVFLVFRSLRSSVGLHTASRNPQDPPLS